MLFAIKAHRAVFQIPPIGGGRADVLGADSGAHLAPFNMNARLLVHLRKEAQLRACFRHESEEEA